MKLSLRLSLIVLGLSLALTLISLFVIREQITTNKTASQKTLSETLLQTIADAVIQDVINDEKVKLTTLLQIAQGYDENPIEYLYVTDMEGLLYAHSYIDGFPEFLMQNLSNHDAIAQGSKPIRLIAKYDIKERGLVYEYNISLISGLTAQLHIGLNQTEIQDLVDTASEKVLVIGLVLSLICTYLAWLATHRTTRPLTEISSQLRQYQAGDQLKLKRYQYAAPEIQILIRTIDNAFEAQNAYEATIKESEQRLRVTIDSIGDAVIATDKEGNITRMNPTAEALTGWTLEEALGQAVKTIFNIVNATTREKIQSPVDKALETGEVVYLGNHTTLIAKDGTEYQITDSTAPIRHDDNSILGMVLVFSDVTEQDKLRQQAARAQEQIQKLFNDMHTMVAVLDDDCSVIFANMRPLIISGLALSDVIGKKLWNCAWFNYEDSLQVAIETDCQNILNKKSSSIQDVQIKTINGLMWIELAFHPQLDDMGNLLQIMVEARDISLRKEMEEEIFSSMQHLKLYREQTPLAAIEWNPDFQVLDWNQAASDMFGYSLEEVKGRYFVDIMLPDSAVVDMKQIWKDLIAQTGGTVSLNENLTKDGRIILCEWHNTPLVDENGQVIGAASLILDVTSKRAALQTLEKKEQEQSEILDTLSDGVITINDRGIILSYNHAVIQLYDIDDEEVLGKSISILIPEIDDKHDDDGSLDEYIQSNFSGPREMIGRHKNKTTFPMHLTVAELPPAEGEPLRFICTIQDLTQIKSQQAQLQRTQKMDALGKLVGGVAHDYNNMLGVIIGYTGLMEMKFSTVEGLQKYIDNINQASERGRQLTKRMLAFSKNESTEAKAVDLHQHLAKQKELFSKAITARIQLDYQLCESPWPIWVDPSELEDCLLNLVINAQHAMSDSGSLTITSQTVHLETPEADLLGLSKNDYMKLSITDTGCGIDDDILDKIFDPFFSTKGADGTGLGLSQVYGFMARVGGVVRVYSQKDIGSEFVLYFPRYKGDTLSGDVKEDIVSDYQGKGETILVVDDEPALREIAKEILTLSGYYVLTARDGKNAIEMLASNSVDLVLSDVIMPNMDGYQLAAHIKAHYPDIKVQLASGFSDVRHVIIADESLHQAMLHKPFNASELLQQVSMLLHGENND